MDKSIQTLLDHALRLENLQQEIVDSVKELIETDNHEKLVHCTQEYRELKKIIKLNTIEWSALEIPGHEYQSQRTIIQNVLLGKPLPIESVFIENGWDALFRDELDDYELEELAENLLWPWFSAEDYVEGLYQLGSIIGKIGEFPEYLSHFVNTVRQCFAFKQYLAVSVLCRTAIEISVRDVFVVEGLSDNKSENYQFVESRIAKKHHKYLRNNDPSFFQSMVILCVMPKYKHLQDELHQLREFLNLLVHGKRSIDKKQAKDIVFRTFKLIHDLYEPV